MPVLAKTGDIFDSQAHTLVNTVNCKGVMGKGLALEFARRYPDMYHEYREICARHALRPGILHLYKNSHPWILNFPTKDHWRSPSRIDYIRNGLQFFVEHYSEWRVDSIAFPRLGCGNGGLAWSEVEPIMLEYLDPLPIAVDIVVADVSSRPVA
jgi:O-acetyl-ADP-ribose deacetylase (regulator of RNase III)